MDFMGFKYKISAPFVHGERKQFQLVEKSHSSYFHIVKAL